MATTAIAAADATARIGSSQAKLVDNFETFLSLLTTQLKNQDPLSPMDGNQFTQQLVQMTGVEQQLLGNQLLTSLVAQGGATLDGAVDLIGKTVTADGKKAELTAKAAEWTYELAADAADAKLTIKDAKGLTVWEGPAPELEAGRHTIEWNGLMTSGQRAPQGFYTVAIEARDGKGKSMPAPINVVGVATAAESIDGDTWLTVGSSKVRLSDITSVRQPSQTAAATAAPTAGTTPAPSAPQTAATTQ